MNGIMNFGLIRFGIRTNLIGIRSTNYLILQISFKTTTNKNSARFRFGPQQIAHVYPEGDDQGAIKLTMPSTFITLAPGLCRLGSSHVTIQFPSFPFYILYSHLRLYRNQGSGFFKGVIQTVNLRIFHNGSINSNEQKWKYRSTDY